jgi:hypothetical protein
VVQLDRYPEWQSQVLRAHVIERDGEGGPVVVETVSDARVRQIRYRLRYEHDPPHRMSWTFIDGDVKDLSGRVPLRGARRRSVRNATFALAVDPGRRLGLLPARARSPTRSAAT